MTCIACGHPWKVLLAHLAWVDRNGDGRYQIAQCPACGHTQSTEADPKGKTT